MVKNSPVKGEVTEKIISSIIGIDENTLKRRESNLCMSNLAAQNKNQKKPTKVNDTSFVIVFALQNQGGIIELLSR